MTCGEVLSVEESRRFIQGNHDTWRSIIGQGAKMLCSLGNHDTWCFLIDLCHFSVPVGRL